MDMKQQNINKVVQAMRLLASEDVQDTYLATIWVADDALIWGNGGLANTLLDTMSVVMGKSGYQWNGVMWFRKPNLVRAYTDHHLHCQPFSKALSKYDALLAQYTWRPGMGVSRIEEIRLRVHWMLKDAMGDNQESIEYCPFCGAKLFEMRMEEEDE